MCFLFRLALMSNVSDILKAKKLSSNDASLFNRNAHIEAHWRVMDIAYQAEML